MHNHKCLEVRDAAGLGICEWFSAVGEQGRGELEGRRRESERGRASEVRPRKLEVMLRVMGSHAKQTRSDLCFRQQFGYLILGWWGSCERLASSEHEPWQGR